MAGIPTKGLWDRPYEMPLLWKGQNDKKGNHSASKV